MYVWTRIMKKNRRSDTSSWTKACASSVSKENSSLCLDFCFDFVWKVTVRTDAKTNRHKNTHVTHTHTDTQPTDCSRWLTKWSVNININGMERERENRSLRFADISSIVQNWMDRLKPNQQRRDCQQTSVRPSCSPGSCQSAPNAIPPSSPRSPFATH